MIDESVLRLFCAKGSFDRRLDNPFSRGAFTYATNGHIMIRIARLESVEEIERPPDVDRVFLANAVALEGTMRPLRAPVPLSPAAVECGVCEGTGYGHDCPDCSCNCPICGGTGTLEEFTIVKIGKRYFSSGYIRLVERLPGAIISDVEGECLAFRFDGGVGLLMEVTLDDPDTASVLDVEL